MTDKRLVLDANILVRAVLGVRARSLIERYAGPVELFVPDAAIAEVHEHLPAIHAKRDLPPEPAMSVFGRLRPFIHELPESLYAAQEAQSKERLASVDEEEWPVLDRAQQVVRRGSSGPL